MVSEKNLILNPHVKQLCQYKSEITVKLTNSYCVVCIIESALDDLDLNDFGASVLERSLESSSALPSVGVMLGILKTQE